LNAPEDVKVWTVYETPFSEICVTVPPVARMTPWGLIFSTCGLLILEIAI
jgi:hypothetical protein